MGQVEHRTVGSDDDGIRLDRWFRRHFPDLGHGRLAKLLRTGQVRLDGKRAGPGDRVASGQVVRVPPLDPPAGGGSTGAAPRPRRTGSAGGPEAAAARAELARWTLYEDDFLLALNKPPGLPVQGGTKIARSLDSMLEALAGPDGQRPRLVHRLDKDTSGVILVAKSAAAAARLAGAFKDRSARKLSGALVVGAPRRRRGRVDAALAKRAGPAGDRVVIAEGEPDDDDADVRRASTRYATVDHAGNKCSWLAMMPLTGRTHQLRVHAASLGTPILGDGKYGGADAYITGGGLSRNLHLHARRIVMAHPRGGRIDVTAPLPEHMRKAWRLFGFDPDSGEDPFDQDA